MAQPTTNSCLKGCLISGLVFVLVVILVIVIGSAVLLNMTPRQLKIADQEFADGLTLESMGLADTKIKDIIKSLSDLMKTPDEKDIVKNSYDATTEQGKADSNMGNSSLTPNDAGGYDYTPILTDKVIYDKEYLKEYKDTTIAYMFDSIIKNTTANTNDAVQFLKDVSATVHEVSLTKNGDKYELRMVVSARIDSMTGDINEATPDFAKLPDKIYMVSYSEVSADEDGILVTVSKDLRVNDASSVVADAIFQLLAGEITDKSGAEGDKNAINDAILEAFSGVIYNLGKIGTADVISGTDEVSGNVVYGNAGIKEHAFTVLTHVAAADNEAEGEDLEAAA